NGRFTRLACWPRFASRFTSRGWRERRSLNESILDALSMSLTPKPVVLEPWDAYNEELVANVHPPDWVNPTSAPRYNLVVIGAGTAGLVTAAGAAGLGAKVALIWCTYTDPEIAHVGLSEREARERD